MTKNIRYFYWHAIFLALTKNFSNINTILPAIIISIGGSDIHLGILTTITLGGARFFQLIFGSYLSPKPKKKPFLLLGINLRITALVLFAAILYNLNQLSSTFSFTAIYVLMITFSISGAFAGISYSDLLGKSLPENGGRKFFIFRQTISSIGVLISAFIVREMIVLYQYPNNYALLLLTGGCLLLIASGGFWKLRESTQSKMKEKPGFWNSLKSTPQMIKKDTNLKHYIFLINLLSLGVVIIPFYISLAKTSFGLTSEQVGNYLILQIAGMLVSNFFWMKISKTSGYKPIVYIFIALNLILPILAIYFSKDILLFSGLFFLSGFTISAYEIVIEGMLIEISTHENRAMYAGIAGAGSLLPLLYPLLVGVFLESMGFPPVFIGTALFSLLALFHISKMNCDRKVEAS